MKCPLAYLITFTTYGTHLHGQASGSVSRWRNTWDRDFVPHCPNLQKTERSALREPAYTLSPAARQVVCDAVVEECRDRGWMLWAVQVRVTHVHCVVQSRVEASRVAQSFKASASRRLNQLGTDGPRQRRWTRGESARNLWTVDQVKLAVDYVLNRQGIQMAVFKDAAALERLDKDQPDRLPHLTEPRAKCRAFERRAASGPPDAPDASTAART